MAWTYNAKGGDQFGKYRILNQIGAGGMGAVYRAVDEEQHREVALKMLPAEAAEDPRRLERFRREAVQGRRLHHDNIVEQVDFGIYDGSHYIALEYVDGVDLEAWVRRRVRLPADEAYAITVQIAKALDHAFEQGVVHRDVKPSNILLTKKQGRLLAKLADLGLARAAGAAESRVTSDGCTVGTVDFMAPEQARDSGRADTRSDIYSLGCTLFHMLAGRPPFANGTLMERVVKHATAAPPDLCNLNPAVPAQFWDVCRRMLAKRPADRYQTPAELLIALTSLSHLLSEAAAGGGLTSTASGARLASPPSLLNVRGPSAAGGRAGASSSRIPSPAISNSPGLTLAGTTTLTDPGQRRVAFEQYEHARVALKAGNDDYALALLLTCCRLAPGDLTYRQALRQAQIHRRGSRSWHPWPVRCYYRLRLELARRRGQPLQVLADGEELLTCAPQDLHVQRAMAQAALDANLPELAVWMLENARAQSPTDRSIVRPLALLYEQQGDARRARKLWEAVLEEDRTNDEARRHLQQLLVQQSSVVQKSTEAVSAEPARHSPRHLIM